MQTDKQGKITFGYLLIFILGGFIGPGIWIVLIPLCLAFLMKTCRFGTSATADYKIDFVDFCVLGICIAEILSCAFSVYFPNSIKSSAPVVMIAFFWFFFRTVFMNSGSIQYLIKGGSVLAFLFSFITIGTFIHFKSEFSIYDASITNFKREYTPMGMPVNDWVSFLLCLLPYPFTAASISKNKLRRLFHFIVSALLTASIVLSLSRGAYLALATFFLISLICSIVVKSRKVHKEDLRLIAIAAVIGLLVVIPARKEVLTTCAMSKTTSQVLSTQGRLQLLDDCISIWKEKPLTGVGAGNFNIVYDSSIVNRKASRTRATNTYALILVEKGVVGLFAYCSLAIIVLVIGFAKMRNDSFHLAFFACFTALCVRGLFFSSIFEHRNVLMMVMLVLLIMFQENYDCKEEYE